MVGLGVALQAILGPGPKVDGLPCTPGTGLAVNIGPGSIYISTGIDATAYGSLPADTVDQIVQQGIAFGQTSLSVPAPGTAGQSIDYLVEVQFQQVDSNPVQLLYYNSANPLQPLLGTATNTKRGGVCAMQVKAGTAATTGTQTAPTPDAGWTGLYVITVPYGATGITTGEISIYPGAPFIQSKLGNFMQSYAGNPNGFVAGNAGVAGSSAPSIVWDLLDNILWVCTTTGTTSTSVWTAVGESGTWPFYAGTSTGTANAQVITLPAAVQSFGRGDEFWFTVGAGLTNTGAATVTVPGTGGGTFPVRVDSGTGPIPLTGGEMVAGNDVMMSFDGTYLHLGEIALGTAARANASSNTGVVAAVTGSGGITVGHVAVFGDTLGTLVDGGPINVAPAPTPINSNTSNLSPGSYLIDTSAGPITVSLLAGVAYGQSWTFKDAPGTWAANNLTINLGSYTITPSGSTTAQAGPLVCNTTGLEFMLWNAGSTLKPF